MLKRLLKLFKKEESFIEVKESEVESYIASRLDELGNVRSEFVREIKRILDETSNKCNALKDAVLRNENIPLRAKQIMEGNRTTYIRNTLNLVDDIEKLIENMDEKTLSVAISEIHDSLSDFNKATQKQFFVLQEFFADESRGIASQLKGIDVSATKLKSTLSDAGYFKYKEIQGLFNERALNVSKSNELNERKTILENEISHGEKAIVELKSEIDEIKESEDYAELKRSENEFDEVNAGIRRLQNRITEKLSPLSRALRKYSKISLDSDYAKKIDDDVFCITKLEPGRLNDFFRNLDKSLHTLDLKESVVKKNLEILRQLDQGWINGVQKEFSDLNDKRTCLMKSIDEDDTQSRIFGLNKDIEHKQQLIDFTKKRIASLSQDIRQIGEKDIDEQVISILLSLRVRVIRADVHR